MRQPFDGPFGGPRGGGFGRHGGPFGGHRGGPFGGHHGGPFGGEAPTAEQQAFWQEARATGQQLMATLSAVRSDPATLAKVKDILTQARIALAALASQQGNTTPTTQV